MDVSKISFAKADLDNNGVLNSNEIKKSAAIFGANKSAAEKDFNQIMGLHKSAYGAYC